MTNRSVLEIGVLVLAAKRITRLVTTDWIGEWTIVRPAKKWAFKHEGPVDVHLPTEQLEDWSLIDPTEGFWRTKLTSGLDCDWCVGVWAAALVTLPMPRAVDAIRSPLLKMLAVSQLVGMMTEGRQLIEDFFEEPFVSMEHVGDAPE